MSIFTSPMTGRKFIRNAPAPMPKIDKGEYTEQFIDPKEKIHAHLIKCIENDSPRDYIPIDAAARILPVNCRDFVKNSANLSRGEMNTAVMDDTTDWKYAGREHAAQHFLEKLQGKKSTYPPPPKKDKKKKPASDKPSADKKEENKCENFCCYPPEIAKILADMMKQCQLQQKEIATKKDVSDKKGVNEKKGITDRKSTMVDKKCDAGKKEVQKKKEPVRKGTADKKGTTDDKKPASDEKNVVGENSTSDKKETLDAKTETKDKEKEGTTDKKEGAEKKAAEDDMKDAVLITNPVLCNYLTYGNIVCPPSSNYFCMPTKDFNPSSYYFY